MIEEGQLCPVFEAVTQDGSAVRSGDFAGKKVVLYFYPKDNTPGCTLQANALNGMFDKFAENNTLVIGVSKDSIECHNKFITKHGLGFDLIADTEAGLCKLFGVYKEKSMFGKKYMGIERSTFIIDEKGIIKCIWRKVKVLGHAEKVLKFVSEI